jgi:hypothetical protein
MVPITRLVGKNTDPVRRAALQIAIQLPEDIGEARNVIDEVGELLEGYLIAGPRIAKDQPRLVREFIPPLKPSRAIPYTLLALAMLMPLGVLLADMTGAQTASGWVSLTGLLIVTLTLGQTYGFLYTAVYAVAHNFLVVRPILQFTPPSIEEYVRIGGMCWLALISPTLARLAYPLRQRLSKAPAVALKRAA